jgi:hypothetical protein
VDRLERRLHVEGAGCAAGGEKFGGNVGRADEDHVDAGVARDPERAVDDDRGPTVSPERVDRDASVRPSRAGSRRAGLRR